MKHLFKPVISLLVLLLIVSCSNDDNEPLKDPFTKNINQSFFKGLEIGNSKFILPKTNVDIHTEFSYEGNKKVKSIFFDVIPYEIKTVKQGEVKWELKNHLVPRTRYEGQKNPHIHYHVYFDEKNKYNPTIIPAEGIYNFRITVEHEDGTKSYVTKKLNIIQKFVNLKVGNNKTITEGDTNLSVKFDYNSGDKTVTEINYKLWFKEWREGERERPDGKKIKKGDWNFFNSMVPEKDYAGKKNPKIESTIKLIDELPVGKYWLNIYAKESGESESVKLSVPFEVTKKV